MCPWGTVRPSYHSQLSQHPLEGRCLESQAARLGGLSSQESPVQEGSVTCITGLLLPSLPCAAGTCVSAIKEAWRWLVSSSDSPHLLSICTAVSQLCLLLCWTGQQRPSSQTRKLKLSSISKPGGSGPPAFPVLLPLGPQNYLLTPAHPPSRTQLVLRAPSRGAMALLRCLGQAA